MAKKGKQTKNKSARGHREDNVLRWRLKQELIRIGRNNEPIPSNPRAIAEAIRNGGLTQPPVDHTKHPPLPPDNVSSFCEAKAKRDKPVAVSGNEAEVVVHTTPKSSGNKHGWLHDKSLASAEFQSWARSTSELGVRHPVQWSKDNKGKLHSAALDAQRQRSIEGHAKTKFKQPPSLVHNPFLNEPASGGYADGVPKSSKPLDPKFYMPPRQTGSAGLTPSGLPIREFVTGKYKPQNAVVYTAPPPTPTRDWRAGAVDDGRYDNSVQVRTTPTVSSWVYKTNAMVQWFINHVEPQNWPSHVHNFVTWKDDGPIPNTGAINKAASHPETELILIRALNQGLEDDWKMLNSALAMAEQEVNLLNQELELVREERATLEYLYAQQTGDHQSAEEILSELNISKTKTPDDADVLLAQFNTFNSFVKVDGLHVAFARYVYGDPRLGEVIKDHADMRCREREDAVKERDAQRQADRLIQAVVDVARHDYESWWRNEYGKQRIKQKLRLSRNKTAVADVQKEREAYARMSRYANGNPLRNRSIYYSTPDATYRRDNSVTAKALIAGIQPGRVQFNNPHLVEGDERESWYSCELHAQKYEKWWTQWLDYCELKYHEATPSGRVKIGVVKTFNKVMDVLNTPVDPSTRRHRKQLLQRMEQERTVRDEKREQRKEERMKRKAERREKEHMRKMYGIAH